MQLLTFIGLILVSFLILVFSFWRLWFCRKPTRSIPKAENVIVSPANGKVVVVRKFDTSKIKVEKWNRGTVEFLTRDVAKKGWFILIMMTPLHVHYQRAPVAGKVLSTTHHPGKFLNAVKEPERLLTLKNECNEILISGKRGKVKVVQIAGALARRITTPLVKNQKVEKGQVIGFINLGSQVALLLPEGTKPTIKPGATVFDGESIVARYR